MTHAAQKQEAYSGSILQNGRGAAVPPPGTQHVHALLASSNKYRIFRNFSLSTLKYIVRIPIPYDYIPVTAIIYGIIHTYIASVGITNYDYLLEVIMFYIISHHHL